MTKILITGENSFIGKSFLKYSKFKDIREVCLIKNAIQQIDFSGFDVVLHLAAIVHVTDKISEEVYFKVNRDLCLETAQKAKSDGIKQFVFLSSVKVFGEQMGNEESWDEQSQCHPENDYAKSKYEAEQELKKLEDENFTVTIIRPCLVYGVGVKANMLSMIKLVDKVTVLPFGRVQNKRSFVAIENLVALIDLSIHQKASGMFIATDEFSLSTTELVKLIAEALNKKIRLITMPGFILWFGKKFFPTIFDRLYGSYEIVNPNTREKLGFNPIISSREGIRRMVEDYKEIKTGFR